MNNLLRICLILLLPAFAIADDPRREDYQDATSAYADGRYLESYYLWKALAEDGHAPSMYNLAVLYARGQGVSQDHGKAAMWYTKSADADYAPALFNLGMAYLAGEGVEQDYKASARLWLKAAEQGNIQAVFNLATLYDKGLGVKKNEKLARNLFRKAANLGDARASAMMSEPENTPVTGIQSRAVTGSEGVRREGWIMLQPDENYTVQVFAVGDEATARKHMSERHLQDAFALFTVSGDNVEWHKVLYGSFERRLDAEAARNEMRQLFSDESPWLRKFREVKGEINAVYAGSATTSSGSQSGMQNSAANSTDISIVFREGQAAFNRQQYGDAIEAWLPLAHSDVVEAQYGIGFMYESGWGVEKDPVQAFHWYQKAAELGHAKSQFNLGMLYQSGRGVDKDEDAAVDWINRAASQKDRRALEYLANAAIEIK